MQNQLVQVYNTPRCEGGGDALLHCLMSQQPLCLLWMKHIIILPSRYPASSVGVTVFSKQLYLCICSVCTVPGCLTCDKPEVCIECEENYELANDICSKP